MNEIRFQPEKLLELISMITGYYWPVIIILLYFLMMQWASNLAEQKKRASKDMWWLITLIPPLALLILYFLPTAQEDKNEPMPVTAYMILIYILGGWMLF